MEKILFLAHTEADGTLPNVAREALTAAIDLAQKLSGSSLSVGLIGREVARRRHRCGMRCGTVSGRFRGGVRRLPLRLRCCRDRGPGARGRGHPDRGADHLTLLPRPPRRCPAPAGTHRNPCQRPGRGRRDPQVQRWYYRQRMVATLTRTQRPWFLVIDGGCFPPLAGEPPALPPWTTWRSTSGKAPPAPGSSASSPLP